jgi:hypothetical protein
MFCPFATGYAKAGAHRAARHARATNGGMLGSCNLFTKITGQSWKRNIPRLMSLVECPMSGSGH